MGAGFGALKARAQVRYEILDPRRIQRGRRPGRTIEWRVSLRTKARFTALLGELVDLENEPWGLDDPENLERAECLRDEIRALPGFPRDLHPVDDTVIPVVTSAQR